MIDVPAAGTYRKKKRWSLGSRALDHSLVYGQTMDRSRQVEAEANEFFLSEYQAKRTSQREGWGIGK